MKNVEECGRMWKNVEECGRIWKNMEEYFILKCLDFWFFGSQHKFCVLGTIYKSLFLGFLKSRKSYFSDFLYFQIYFCIPIIEKK